MLYNSSKIWLPKFNLKKKREKNVFCITVKKYAIGF
jgi:hypothetical protein